MFLWSLKAVQSHISKLEALSKLQNTNLKNVDKNCIVKVFRKLYIKYKTNPMNSNCNITKLILSLKTLKMAIQKYFFSQNSSDSYSKIQPY